MAGAFDQNVATANGLQSLFSSFFGSKGNTTTHSGGTETEQKVIDDATLQRILQGGLESAQGLHSVATGQRTAGLYNSTTNKLLSNDLLSRLTAKVAEVSAPTVKTSTPKVTTVANKGAIQSVNPLLQLAGVAAVGMGAENRKKLLSSLGLLGGSDTVAGMDMNGSSLATAFAAPTGITEGAMNAELFSQFNIDPASFAEAGSAAYSGLDIAPEVWQTAFDGSSGIADSAINFGELFSGSAAFDNASLAADFSTDLFASAGTDLAADFSTDLFADSAGSALDSSGLPLSSVLKAASGDVQGGVESGVGYAAGYAVGGPVGGAIGSAVAEPVFEIASDLVQAAGDIVSDVSVICTELHAQGLMDAETFKLDQAFGKTQSAETLAGYHFWAKPLVSLMRKSSTFTKLVAGFALPWAKHMSHLMDSTKPDSFFGRSLMFCGKPICTLLGKVILTRTELANWKGLNHGN